MSLEFFGQFLLGRGEIDELQLRQALALMDELNQTVGALAVEHGFATEADCRRVNDEQKHSDLPFGELAMQMGVLNSVELEEVLAVQQRTRVDLAKALVELGHLPEDRVRALHDAWKGEQAFEATGTNELPRGLAANRTAIVAIGVLARMCRRVADLKVMVGPGRALEGLPDMVLVSSVEVLGTQPLRVTLMTDALFGERLTEGLLGMQLDSLASELSLDGGGEFLNVWLGNVVSSLAHEALDLRLSPPSYGVLPSRGWGFEVVTEAQGAAHVVLEPIDAP